MKNIQVKCVGVRYTVEVPETVEEYDHLAGKAGSALSSATMNVIYRSTNAAFRALFCEAVEEETGIDRARKVVGTKTVKGPDGEEIEEQVTAYEGTEKDYLDMVYDQLGLETEEQIAARFGDQIAAVEAKLKFDPSGREPSSGTKPKRAKKSYRDTAEHIMTTHGEAVLTQLAEKLGAELGITVEPTTEGIAIALQTRDERRDVLSEILGG